MGSDGTKLFVKESGNGKPLILLAGGPGLNAIYLDSIVVHLSSKYRCIVLDQRGTGKSTIATLDAQAVTIKNYVSDLEALRKHLKQEKLTLVGHSWGGMLSLHYVATYPNRVERLVLLNPGGPTRKFQAYFEDNIRMRLHEEDSSFVWVGYFFNRESALASKPFFAPQRLFGQDLMKTIQYAMTDYFATEEERIRLLPQFKGAVSLIQGRQDPVGESTAYEIKNYLPQTKLHFIEKCGHFPWLEKEEQSRQFFNLLISCLDK
jgi:proline iminopeptidase